MKKSVLLFVFTLSFLGFAFSQDIYLHKAYAIKVPWKENVIECNVFIAVDVNQHTIKIYTSERPETLYINDILIINDDQEIIYSCMDKNTDSYTVIFRRIEPNSNKAMYSIFAGEDLEAIHYYCDILEN